MNKLIGPAIISSTSFRRANAHGSYRREPSAISGDNTYAVLHFSRAIKSMLAILFSSKQISKIDAGLFFASISI